MKKCVASVWLRLLTALAAMVCGGMAVFIWRIGEGEGLSVLFLVALFGGVCIRGFWNVYALGGRGFLFDEEKIVLALSRKDHREFRWDELRQLQEKGKIGIYFKQVASWLVPETVHFCFADQKKIRELAATPRMTEYDAFVAMLKKKGIQIYGYDGGRAAEKEAINQLYQETFGRDLFQKDKDGKK